MEAIRVLRVARSSARRDRAEALNQMRGLVSTAPTICIKSDLRTRAYVERRTGDGLSKLERIRCLKRYVAREVYHQLRPAAD